MAEASFGFDPDESPARASAGMGYLINIAGAVTSVALLAGVAWWGYRLAVLDVTGVPVLQAVQGPMRVAPADPGGRIAAHTGLAVNAVVATGGAARPAERVALAPPPASFAPDDLAPAVAAPPAASAEAAPVDTDLAIEAAVARALSESAIDIAETAPAGDTGNGLARSLRPRARPGAPGGADLASLGLSGLRSVAARAVEERDPASLRPGTRLAQLGAYDDAEAARADWDRIAARAGALIEGKARVLQPATSAGRDFIRLRVASFESEDDARRFCTAIESGDLRCVPVTHR
ncbi:MAG: SPOR domain-containing protein [Gemmobacter sp.]